MRSRASIAASNRSAVGFVDVFFHCRWNTGRAGIDDFEKTDGGEQP